MGLCLLFHLLACNCNRVGSTGITCNDYGVCSCKANIINDKCTDCDDGYFNFPTCDGKQYYICITGCPPLPQIL